MRSRPKRRITEDKPSLQQLWIRHFRDRDSDPLVLGQWVAYYSEIMKELEDGVIHQTIYNHLGFDEPLAGMLANLIVRDRNCQSSDAR